MTGEYLQAVSERLNVIGECVSRYIRHTEYFADKHKTGMINEACSAFLEEIRGINNDLESLRKQAWRMQQYKIYNDEEDPLIRFNSCLAMRRFELDTVKKGTVKTYRRLAVTLIQKRLNFALASVL
ncbi:MAG: hypothetical protein PHS46_08520 [Candidatus Omnitrophica bacterium]|nr:hypothetical protein [Candidatus Omnitrophota bacterium]